MTYDPYSVLGVLHRDMLRIRQRLVLPILQIIILGPGINLEELLYPAFDLLHRDIFIVLRGVRPHFQPQQSRCPLDLNPAHDDIAVMY